MLGHVNVAYQRPPTIDLERVGSENAVSPCADNFWLELIGVGIGFAASIPAFLSKSLRYLV